MLVHIYSTTYVKTLTDNKNETSAVSASTDSKPFTFDPIMLHINNNMQITNSKQKSNINRNGSIITNDCGNKSAAISKFHPSINVGMDIHSSHGMCVLTRAIPSIQQDDEEGSLAQRRSHAILHGTSPSTERHLLYTITFEAPGNFSLARHRQAKECSVLSLSQRQLPPSLLLGCSARISS